MKSAERAKLLKSMRLPSFFIKKGSLAYYLIEENNLVVLVGIYLDSCSDKDLFFVQYFIQPMFIPFPTFIFSIGYRVGDYWSANDIIKIEKELSKLKEIISFKEVQKILKASYMEMGYPGALQFSGFIDFVYGDFSASVKQLHSSIREKDEVIRGYRKEEIANIEIFISHLENSDFKSFKEKLLIDQNFTMKSLKIEKL
jgi:hypothetical protein